MRHEIVMAPEKRRREVEPGESAAGKWNESINIYHLLIPQGEAIKVHARLHKSGAYLVDSMY